MTEINVIDVDKIGSATSPLALAKTAALVSGAEYTKAGDVVVVRALTDSATYNMLELPTGRRAHPAPTSTNITGRRGGLGEMGHRDVRRERRHRRSPACGPRGRGQPAGTSGHAGNALGGTVVAAAQPGR